MAIVQQIQDGKVVDNSTTSSTTTTSSSNTYDKEMFLKLLVAEMQYQDPLEPTSNTEYVSELASFSQIEAVQSVQDQMSTLEGNSLVGKNVILLENDTYISGKVDYVTTEDDEIKLSVNDKLYSIDSLDSVCDEEYYNAVANSQTFSSMISSLPTTYSLTIADEDKLKSAREFLDGLTTYEKQFISSDNVTSLEKLEDRMKQLKEASESADDETTEESEEV